MTFTFRWRPIIFDDMVATLLANTPLTDIYPGSAVSTLLQVAAIEDARQYAMMGKILEAFNLDTTEGTDLDDRAFEYGLTRRAASGSSGNVTISDSTISKVETNIYPGTPGPVSGAVTVNVVPVASLGTSGSVIIGRGTNNAETVAFSSVTDNTAYYTLNLSAGLANDHGTEETVILSQGGNRIIEAGTIVKVPESDISEAIEFTTNSEETLLDGEDTLEGVAVTCAAEGSGTRVPAGSINQFFSEPFTGAEVTNELPFTNGSDEESDQELRDRIRAHGVSDSSASGIVNYITGLIDTDEDKRVVSAKYVDATDEWYNTVYIDDGTGFEPSYEGQGVETVMQEAAGTEEIVQLQNMALMKASLITDNEQPFDVSFGDTLVIDVDGTSEEITFISGDFLTDGAATAVEIAARINSSSTLVQARTTEESTKVIITVIAEENERLQILSGTANVGLSFPEGSIVETLRLYKNDQFLYKDGRRARVETDNLVSSMDFSSGPFTFDIVIDGKTSNTLTITINSGDFSDPSNPTADEIAASINDDLVGAVASGILNGTKIRIESNSAAGSTSTLEVQSGGSALGSTKLDFPTTEQTGIDADYTLNRVNGQIELATPLVALDKIEAGSRNTRGFLDCASPEPYAITSGQTLVISVDGSSDITYTFASSDVYTSQEIIDLVTADRLSANNLNGATLESVNRGGSNYLRIRTNTFDTSGSINVKSSSTATALDFTTDTAVSSIEPNVAHVLSNSTEDFTLGTGQTLVVEIDDDAVNRTFSVSMDVDGTVTTGTSTTQFTDSSLVSSFDENDFFNGFLARFDDDTATVALRSQIVTVSDYDATTGQLTTGTLPATPAIGDTFTLIPVTALNVVELLNNHDHTTIGIFSEISMAGPAGNQVQIASLLNGSAGYVHVIGGSADDFTIPFETDGTAGGTFTVNSITGLSIGLDVEVADDDSSALGVTITDITGSSAPYTITVDSGATNLSAYTTAQNAVLIADNPLDFSNVSQVGIDGYRNYTGLLRLVQRTISGWDADLVNYPGIQAAGARIAVDSPVIQRVEIEVDVTTISGVSLITISDDIRSTIAAYVNGLKVGQDVVLSEIISRIKRNESVYDVTVTTPSVNVVVADDALAKTDLDHITVS